MPRELRVSVGVDAPQQVAWDALVDWERQGEWMLATTVRPTTRDGRGVGAGIEGRTGFGRLGFLDTMVISEWDPPRRCAVQHTGRVVRGTASFDVLPDSPTRSRVVWRESLDAPAWLWLLVALPAWLGVQWSLRRFARQVKAG